MLWNKMETSKGWGSRLSSRRLQLPALSLSLQQYLLICNDWEAPDVFRVSPVCDFPTSSSQANHHRYCINIKFLMRESDGLNQRNSRDFAHPPTLHLGCEKSCFLLSCLSDHCHPGYTWAICTTGTRTGPHNATDFKGLVTILAWH